MPAYWAKIRSLLYDRTIDAHKIHCTVLNDSTHSNRTFRMH